MKEHNKYRDFQEHKYMGLSDNPRVHFFFLLKPGNEKKAFPCIHETSITFNNL